MFLHRSIFSDLKTYTFFLLPYPLMLKPFYVARDNKSTKRLRSSQHNRPVLLNNALVMRPKRLERNHRVPFAGRCPVGQVAENHIHAGVGQCSHRIQAVSMDQRRVLGRSRGVKQVHVRSFNQLLHFILSLGFVNSGEVNASAWRFPFQVNLMRMLHLRDSPPPLVAFLPTVYLQGPTC